MEDNIRKILIITFVVLFCGFIIAALYGGNSTISTEVEQITGGIWIVVLIALISGLITKCPSCKEWWSRKSLGREELGRKDGYKTVTRHDTHRTGDKITHTTRKEQIHVTHVTYRYYWRCKDCRHEWTTISTKEYE